MKVRLLKSVAGVDVGYENDVPYTIGKTLVDKGIAEEVKAIVEKESKVESFETKENKSTSKRKTKSRK